MSPLDWLLFIPAVSGAVLLGVTSASLAAWLNLAASAGTLWAAVALARQVLAQGAWYSAGGWFYLDAFSVFLVALTALVAFTTSAFSRPYLLNEVAKGRITAGRLRLYHGVYQWFVLGMLVALTSDNLGLLWIALEAATLATVLLVSLYRTPDAILAAWRYLILCGVGIALALFGTILLFAAGSEVLGHGDEALRWSQLHLQAEALAPGLMLTAFVFFLVGYGTKVGLVPLHRWLPDAHAEGPTPISAVLSGLLLNVALYALVRCKSLVDASAPAGTTGSLMAAFAILTVSVAAVALHRQRDVKRFFSYSSIEHMGLMTLAFAIGTPLALFAGLLHMTVHALVKSGIFFAVGHASQAMGGQQIHRIRGLVHHHPALGWGLVVATLAIAGFPPFGLFTSEFLLFTAAVDTRPVLAAWLLLVLGVAFAGLLRQVQPMAYGAPPADARPVTVSLWPLYLHLAVALWLGLSIPDFLADWYRQAAHLLGGAA